MKKSIYYSMVVLAGLLLTNACSKDKPVVPIDPTEESAGITLPETISVTIPDNLTRVSLTQDEDADGAVKLAWQETDKIYVADHDDLTAWIEYDIDTPLGDNPHAATFHRVGEEISASRFDILFGAPTLATAKGINFSEQEQEGNANTDHLQYMALISNVSTVENVQFTSDWASANGGSFKQTGVVRLRLQMPTNVTAVSFVFLAASSAVFNTTNELDGKTDMIKVNFTPAEDITEDGNIVTVYANLPWEDVSVSAGTDLTAVVKASDGYYYSKAIPNAGITFSTGSVNAVKLSRSGFGVFAGGSGDDGDPYTIASKWHMMNTKPRTVANAGSVTYFKLLNDIDMSGLYWIPLNNVANSDKLFNQYINFDGNNHTISNLATDPGTIPAYPSLFGVLQGSVKDLTIDHAIITPGSNKAGVLAGYIGTGTDYTGEKIVENVHITNSSVKNGTSYCGGFAAQMNRVGYSFSNCSVEHTEVLSTSLAAGFIAYFQKAASVSDVRVYDTEVKGAGPVGGLSGQVIAACEFSGVTVDDCAVISTESYLGGLVGEVSGAATFDDCRVDKGTITYGAQTDKIYVGGAFGYFHNSGAKVGVTDACSVNVLVTAYNYAGGFIGYLDGGTISNNSAEGTVKAHSSIGGFVGYCNAGTLSSNSTSVNFENGAMERNKPYTNVGGFVGNSAGGAFESNHATGNVIASQNTAGGFVGYSTGTSFTGNDATGNVTAVNNVGGFAGYCVEESSFTGCFAKGVVSGQQGVGGFAGRASNISFTNCSYRGTSVTGSQASGNAMLGGFCGYTETTACTFTSCYVYNEYGTTVTGATQRVGGFIGQLALGGDSITKCYVKDVSVYGSGNNYGAFCGVQYAPIEKSWVDGGTVTAGGNNVGGFSGYQEKAALTDCFSTANIVGSSYSNIGGITGQLRNQNNSTITNCYYAGSLSGTGTQGGIVGLAAGTNCTVTACISWDSTLPVCGSSGTVSSCYVKSASETGTVSSHAQESPRSWSSTVWDFSTDLPTLK